MPTPDSTMAWGGALAWLGVILIASFLITWVLTDLFRVGRTVYIGLLALMTGALTYGYLTWSGTDVWGFVRAHWAWGLLGAFLSGGITAVAARRMRDAPAAAPVHGIGRALGVAWEDIVYGAAEGILLSALPVLTVWQALERVGWTGGWAGKLGTGALAVSASLVVIAVHHLGYREFRGRQLVYPVAGCVWFTLAYLLTASPIAAAVGHMGLHAGLGAYGRQLPPYHVTAGITDRSTTALRAA